MQLCVERCVELMGVARYSFLAVARGREHCNHIRRVIELEAIEHCLSLYVYIHVRHRLSKAVSQSAKRFRKVRGFENSTR